MSAETNGAGPQNSRAVPRPFNLLLYFAALGLFIITVTGIATAWALERLYIGQILARDAVASMEVIQSIADSGNLNADFRYTQKEMISGGAPGFFSQVISLPGVFRASVYRPDRSILWSNDPYLIGKTMTGNEELLQALEGEMMFEVFKKGEHRESVEHSYIGKDLYLFVENYIPIWDRNREKLLGVVEIYKNTNTLIASVSTGMWWTWGAPAISGAILFAALMLFLLVTRSRMQRREDQLIESETFAALGEMAYSVAHSIRNPLASIRSSAELAQEEPDLDLVQEVSRDIIADADRVERVVCEMTLLTRQEGNMQDTIAIDRVVGDCVDGLSTVVEERGLSVSLDIREPVMPLIGDGSGLRLALDKAFATAIDGVPEGGRILVGLGPVNGGGFVELTIASDSDSRLAGIVRRRAKPRAGARRPGLGLDMSMVKRVVEHHGGTFALSSLHEKGTTITIQLPTGAV